VLVEALVPQPSVEAFHEAVCIAAPLGNGVELSGDTLARERVVDDRGQALPTEVVNDAQDAEAASIDQRVEDEVEAPALVGLLRYGHRRPRAERSLAATTLLHR
jgi:hypothetical protein